MAPMEILEPQCMLSIPKCRSTQNRGGGGGLFAMYLYYFNNSTETISGWVKSIYFELLEEPLDFLLLHYGVPLFLFM